MPPHKRQKPLHDSGVFLDSDSDDSAFDSHLPRKGRSALKETSGNALPDDATISPGEKLNVTDDINSTAKPITAPYGYICIHRPYFDVDGENWHAWSRGEAERLEEDDIFSTLYQPILDAETKAGIPQAPAAQHEDHKWIMMWNAWQKQKLLSRKATYCDPSNFDMNLYNDWNGWGIQEIIENVMVEFDMAWRGKGKERVDEMWVAISALGLWLNTEDPISALVGNKDGETTCELISLVGCALLTALSAIDEAGELKDDSRLLDLPLVIANYLELSYDLPAYGIEGQCVAWRKEAVVYFRKGELDVNKGLFATDLRMSQLEKASNDNELSEDICKVASVTESNAIEKEGAQASPSIPVSPLPSAKKRRFPDLGRAMHDKWLWVTSFQAYKKRQHPKMGGHHYDITKMSSKDRAAAACNGKDPLAGVPAKDLKDDLFELASMCH